MCLAARKSYQRVEGVDPAFRARNVDFCGVIMNLAFTPDVIPGDSVLVHVGFALTRIDEEEAARTYQYLAQIGALEEGLTQSHGRRQGAVVLDEYRDPAIALALASRMPRQVTRPGEHDGGLRRADAAEDAGRDRTAAARRRTGAVGPGCLRG